MVHVRALLQKVHDGRRLAVQDGALLRVVEAFGQDLTGLPARDDAPERRVGVAARNLYCPPHETLVVQNLTQLREDLGQGQLPARHHVGAIHDVPGLRHEDVNVIAGAVDRDGALSRVRHEDHPAAGFEPC